MRVGREQECAWRVGREQECACVWDVPVAPGPGSTCEAELGSLGALNSVLAPPGAVGSGPRGAGVPRAHL